MGRCHLRILVYLVIYDSGQVSPEYHLLSRHPSQSLSPFSHKSVNSTKMLPRAKIDGFVPQTLHVNLRTGNFANRRIPWYPKPPIQTPKTGTRNPKSEPPNPEPGTLNP